MRAFLTGSLVAAAASALAQVPDVTIKLDSRLTYRTVTGGSATQRFYDALGRASIISLGFNLEPGFKGYVSQRFQRIRHDGDPDQLEEYFIEDPGLWRVGKQFVPFGVGAFIRESAIGARGDFELPFEGATFAVAVVDSGVGRQRGIVGRLSGRLSGRYGLSFAIGDHWGISGSSLTLVRNPEDSSGVGRGYQRMFGIDYSQTLGPFFLRAEWITLAAGAKALDPNRNLYDVSLTLDPRPGQTFTLGYTKSHEPDADFYRIGGSIQAHRNVFVEPMARWRNSSVYDFQVAVRIKF